MKLGLGLYRNGLTEENFSFARQLGVESIVIHLVNYYGEKHPKIDSGNQDSGLAYCGDEEIWTEEELKDLVRKVESHGLAIEAIENFSPNFWYDILLDGPEKEKQMEGLKRLIRNMGRAGIQTIGYNFSIAGLWGWRRVPHGRGGAETVCYDESLIDKDSPIPDGFHTGGDFRHDAFAHPVGGGLGQGPEVAALDQSPNLGKTGGEEIDVTAQYLGDAGIVETHIIDLVDADETPPIFTLFGSSTRASSTSVIV